LALDQVSEEAGFRAAGYTSAATLLYMACDGASYPDQPPDLELSLEPVTPTSEPRLEALIEASYQGTLDCPLLNGLRTTQDVLAGYRAVGTRRPELWLLARRGKEDAGCLILADHPEVDNLELVYLGLIPAVRGNGYGLALTRHALWLARQLQRQRVVLAVDASNTPAIRLYEAAGFFGFDQRLVNIKKL
jgi:ribosomal protein S18 acetylase RimI-like enzyme